MCGVDSATNSKETRQQMDHQEQEGGGVPVDDTGLHVMKNADEAEKTTPVAGSFAAYTNTTSKFAITAN